MVEVNRIGVFGVWGGNDVGCRGGGGEGIHCHGISDTHSTQIPEGRLPDRCVLSLGGKDVGLVVVVGGGGGGLGWDSLPRNLRHSVYTDG